MKAVRKIIEYSIYVLVILIFTFILSLFNGSGRRFSFNPSAHQLLSTTNISKEFDSKNKVVYFWATWCGVCQTNLPLFKASYSLLGASKNIEFISIEEGSGTPEHVKKYIDKYEISFPTFFGDPKLLEENKISAYPTTLFVNSKNEVKFIDTGIMNPLSIWIRIFFLNWN